MKIESESLILPLLICVSFLACSNWYATDRGESAGQELLSRRKQAIESQKVLDDMKSTIRDMRKNASKGSPEQRAVLEQELIPIEKLLQQTQRQLLLYAAEDDVTRRLIEQAFQVAPTSELLTWKSGG